MKRLFLLVSLIIVSIASFSQLKIKARKYPSLLWEISGNGLKKPSYLFGTMHVSSKIAFHLSDSFYLGIKQAEVVALETNPESWQEDMSKYDAGNGRYPYGWKGLEEMPNDYLNIRSLRIDKYEKLLEAALFTEPSVINNLLYRSYSDNASDFEEDTYLDMYIYQVGKKLGKKVAGVEDYGESMKLMMEAYRDAARDKNRKEKSYDYDVDLSPMKLQEAYRSGNLDLLDSINRLNSYSDAFDEKFLFRRNEIQANSIDSILKRSSLFVGVGAAHLPGPRGVIELLRLKGYKLRPIIMGKRDSKHKDLVEKLRVPVVFNSQASADGLYKVDVPGKFYDDDEYGNLDQRQYADLANGSYYMVTRVKTNALFWGHGTDVITRKIDSMLYENVPGKILSKSPIIRNGYKGFDITNRTRRGDYQRYNIFILPFEVIFFKMSGVGDYVKTGDEARKFFSSIQFREFRNGSWKRFQPSYGGFSVDFPHEPNQRIESLAEYSAEDKASKTHFTVYRIDIHNYGFAEEDSFDLGLMDESFASSDFIEKQIYRQHHTFKDYPALDSRYLHKDGSVSFLRHLIKGPHYYTLVAHGPKADPGMDRFLNSFELKPYSYGVERMVTDSAMSFSVKTPWYPVENDGKIALPADSPQDQEDAGEDDAVTNGVFQGKLISNDSTGEAIYVVQFRSPRYYYTTDSSGLQQYNNRYYMGGDHSWIIRKNSTKKLPGGWERGDLQLSDTNSSRAIWSRVFYRKGAGFMLMTQMDTLEAPGSFIGTFFENFMPADSVTSLNPFEKKSVLFFNDFFTGDSISRKRAILSVRMIKLDSADFPQLKRAIESFSWADRKYLDTKKSFINKLASIKTNASADYLREIYFAAGDTVELQYSALEAMLKIRDQYAFNVFRDIITSDPPVLETNNYVLSRYPGIDRYLNINSDYSNNSFIDELYDSLKLTRTILPDLLALLTLDDYQWPMMRLLRTMVDSNLVDKKDYSVYFSKFLLEAKQELKKQTIGEKKKAIEKAEEQKEEKNPYTSYMANQDLGNEELSIYATLLLPFWDSNPNVSALFSQLLASNDNRLKYNITNLLLRNGKAIPDTMLRHFALMDDYRYELHSDLKELNALDKFPTNFRNHLDLARSKLISSTTYDAPDSIQYLDKLQATFRSRKGYIYFFRYKNKKDDAGWKLATVGLIPLDPRRIEFEEEAPTAHGIGWNRNYSTSDQYDFTEFTDIKLRDDEPLKDQLNKELKKMMISKRKSAKMFYDESDGYEYGETGIAEDR